MKREIKRLFTIAVIAGSFILTSCVDDKKDKNEQVSGEQQEMNDHSEEMKSENGSEEANAEFNDQNVTKAYEEYLAVKDALVGTDAAAAGKAAQNLEKTLAEAKPEIAGIAGKLAESEDVNVQREIFSELTAAMEPVLKDAISSGKIYKQFCPMAFEGKGDYWYSNSEEIRNPYFGDKMLKCGRVDNTIM
ncbi:DUF3347 domain-containing protein [Christiangramia sp. SM2212]|uniref:DUF3347 domain-containing protein n=1 Tax=Christiangramia sediminicola TaxID=3073267 RepID=A0ABU1EUC4_9FLAO|nr:DUF3347 domain-containing protein [Christiangramia sp. SM2212]MDR5591976.1 DUF3347 domain-containing protein [Christiangramia sp. SM2212]